MNRVHPINDYVIKLVFQNNIRVSCRRGRKAIGQRLKATHTDNELPVQLFLVQRG